MRKGLCQDYDKAYKREVAVTWHNTYVDQLAIRTLQVWESYTCHGAQIKHCPLPFNLIVEQLHWIDYREKLHVINVLNNVWF